MGQIEGGDKNGDGDKSIVRVRNVSTAGQLVDSRNGMTALVTGDTVVVRDATKKDLPKLDTDQLVPDEESSASEPMEDDTV